MGINRRQKRGRGGYSGLIKPLLPILVLLSAFQFQACKPKPNYLISASGLIEQYGQPHLIPQSKSIKIGEQSFVLDEQLTVFSNSLELNAAKRLVSFLDKELGLTPPINSETASKAVISFLLDKTNEVDNEAYQLSIGMDSVLIKANSESGLSHGLSSLMQLIHQYRPEGSGKVYLPSLIINDSPAFKHRGLLLDVCRHFFDKETVKKYIDELAYYKMNVLHWHLTEDQGWRVQIDKYPRLTEISSWRRDTSGELYGGFYGKEDLHEIVEYASERNITIIPEIELPGHSQAALAAYPQLSCEGRPVEVANDWGVFKEIYCAGNDSTFTFLEDVLAEVLDIFPSKYIHIGGDEAPKYRWEHCKKCQRRMADEGLHDEHELQSYFIKRIEKFLNSKGRILIGWDEILEGGLSPNATVQSWRGIEHGITAASQHHNVIMSPTSHCYFDYDLKSIDLNKVYHFDPIPEELDSSLHHYILGGECNMWTEHVPDENNLDSKVFPRILAMSEVLWSYPHDRNFEEFLYRVQHHYKHLKSEEIQYGLEGIPVKLELQENDGQLKLKLTEGVPGLQLMYRTPAHNQYREYTTPIPLNFNGALNVQATKNGDLYGNVFSQEIAAHYALNTLPNYKGEYNKWYTAGGDKGLTNGLLGSLDFRDGNWQGFWGKDLDVEIELDTLINAKKIELGFYQYNNAWIFFPKAVEVWVSSDGESWQSLDKKRPKTQPRQRGKLVERLDFWLAESAPPIAYVKVKAKNLGKVPDWHEAAGSDCWIFIDEIIVQ